MKAIFQWWEDRTGFRGIRDYLLKERIPGGSRWRYVWGSTLMYAFMVQVVTGVFLWMSYSPSAQTAWPSVYYIQHELWGGWLLRGLHHFTAQLMVLLLGIHLVQVVWDGAYRPPREVNYWFGLIMLTLVLALALTGYLLPWDQKGYWATKVSTNIAGIAPGLGPIIQRLAVGGSDYGHQTLTRFFALHAGVLPGLLSALMVGHIFLFRRHGVTVKAPVRKPDQAFWPAQALKDALVCMAVIIVVLVLVFRHAIWPGSGPLGAELGAPADGAEPFGAARPEWYFLFLFEFLKLFPQGTEVWGAIVLPTIVFGYLLAMPVIGRSDFGHRLNCVMLLGLVTGIIALTIGAIVQDQRDPRYQEAVRDADALAVRAVQLAKAPGGIPAEGGVALLQSDPLTQGPKLFARYCAGCHRFDGHDGMGNIPSEQPTASDLKGFGSRSWLTGFFDPQQITTPRYYGGTALKTGRMAKFVHDKVSAFSSAERANLEKAIIALSAEAQLKSQQTADARDAAIIREGTDLVKNHMGCVDCHSFQSEDPSATAPDLTGYGSRTWMIGMMSNPASERYFHKRNDRMPAFGDQLILNRRELGLLADWLRGEWYEPTQTQFPVAEK
jgi:ubiquinol-cytochrome c reductase cytochrome b subunit